MESDGEGGRRSLEKRRSDVESIGCGENGRHARPAASGEGGNAKTCLLHVTFNISANQSISPARLTSSASIEP